MAAPRYTVHGALDDPTWPVLHDDALHGITGEIVREIEPCTEADPIAVLANLLVFFGTLIGRSVHFRVSGTNHFSNIYVAIVGNSSGGRKGTSLAFVRNLAELLYPWWDDGNIKHGLSTGPGLIYEVRDPSEHTNKDGDPVDVGTKDKRRLVVEEELSSVLRVIALAGNTLSPVLRLAWDGRPLGVLSKTAPCRATNAHISILAHASREELVRLLPATEIASGLASRFMFVAVRRSRYLPDGGGEPDLEQFVPRLIDVMAHCLLHRGELGQVRRDAAADALWRDAYPRLTQERPGLLAAITARAAPQVLRLSALYAALDSSLDDRLVIVEAPHMRAALAFWAYCYESARNVFGDGPGDPMADTTLGAVRSSGTEGVTRTDLSRLFSGHKKSRELDAAIHQLVCAGLVVAHKNTTTSPPTIIYRLPASP